MLPAFLTKKHPTSQKAKAKLIETFNASRETVAAKKAQFSKTQELVCDAACETARTTSSLMAMLSKLDDGVLFLDYKGTVLHANQVAYRVLGVESDKLIGKSIESLLSAKSRVKRSVQACSQALFERLQGQKLSLTAIADVCKSFSVTTVSATELTFNTPIVLPFGTDQLTVRLGLLETAPASLQDVTYICKLTRSQA